MDWIHSYLIVLRRHWVLAACLAAVVLAAGWTFSMVQVPLYRVSATVQIRPRPNSWYGGNEIWIEDDRNFISDRVFRIRKDSELAQRVVDRIRAWAALPALPPSLAGSVAPEELKGLAATVVPEGLGSRLSIDPVPSTSYYVVGVTGPAVAEAVVLANAYAEEIVALFREESLNSVKGHVEEWEKQAQDRRDRAEASLAALREQAAGLQRENPAVDVQRRTSRAQQELDQVRASVLKAQEDRDEADASFRAASDVLAAHGLAFRTQEEAGGSRIDLLPPSPRPPAEDPRLSPAVQAVAAVAADEESRRARDRLLTLADLDQSLAEGTGALRAEAPERKAVQARIRRAESDLASRTEAVLCALARGADESRRRLGRLEERARALEPEARAGAATVASIEQAEKKCEDLRREIASCDDRLGEAAVLRRTFIQAGVADHDLVRRVQDARASYAELITPDRTRMLLITLAAAILSIAGLAYLLQAIDDTVKSRSDFDRHIRGVAFLGVIPPILDGAEDGLDFVRERTGTPLVECIRALRTTLEFAASGGEARTILFTSCAPREGKTTLSANLAAAFAQGGRRTLLVDADLRRPRIHRVTGVPGEVGLSTLLAGSGPLQEAVLPCPGVPNLHVLPAGALPLDPTEILQSPRMGEILREAARLYDRVIIDSPPVINVTDPCILAPHADVVVMVIAHGRTPVRLVRRAREALETVGVRIHGAVVNHMEATSGFYGLAGYGYSYRDYAYGTAPLSGAAAGRERAGERN